MTSICVLLLAGLFTLAGCQHYKANDPSVMYTLDDLSVETNRAAGMVELGRYNDYRGKVIRVSPKYGRLWGDYTRPVYRDLDECSGLYRITVSMSILAEKAPSEKPPSTNQKQIISAYRPEPVTSDVMNEGMIVPLNTVEYAGPANIGMTYQNGDRGHDIFGGSAIEVPEGEWVDLVFSQVIDFVETGPRQVFIDGLNDYHGLVDLILYVRHFQVTAEKITQTEEEINE